MDDSQKIQAEQYSFPYHFLPVFEEGRTRLTQQWNWAPSYLAALQLITAWMQRTVPNGQRWEHIDIGCGDGALLYHLEARFRASADIGWTGVDYDAGAIRWAQMFGGDRIRYLADDIGRMPADSYDSATLIEVAEHIPPDQLDAFAEKIVHVLKPGGRLVVTVPHRNKTVQPKHFQHFSFEGLRKVFEPRLELESIGGFGRHSRLSRLLQRLIINRTYVFTYAPLTETVLSRLRQVHRTEEGVARIFAEFRKPA